MHIAKRTYRVALILICSATAALIVALLLDAPRMYATASFSRQTGLACTKCHTTFPELTEFGRTFKLQGYTLSADENKDIKSKGEKKEAPLSLGQYLPLSINLRGSYTQLDERVPGTRKPNVEVPQQINLWFAGKLSEHAGGYIQMTYNVENNHFNFDNSDARYARQSELGGKTLDWGIDFNNNPTIEDLWQSTPAYGFPWSGPDSTISPNAATLIDGGLSGDVVGLGTYGMWDKHLYGDVTLYYTQHIGGPQPATGADSTGAGFPHNIAGVAPYWRAAWQGKKGDNYLEVGTYGIHVESYPGAITGLTDDFTDNAVDATYERKTRPSEMLVVHSTFIYEQQNLHATFAALGAARPDHTLKTFRLDAGYHFGSRYTLTGGPFYTSGTTDAKLYAPGPLTGSANGSPNNHGWIAQLAYWPVQNIEIGTQYRHYSTFNGLQTNYDGSGRNAPANSYVYGFIWVSF
jgi:hypothetical protein